jgi:hypothetical protein
LQGSRVAKLFPLGAVCDIMIFTEKTEDNLRFILISRTQLKNKYW